MTAPSLRKLLPLLPTIALALQPICSTGCTREVPVAVPVTPPPCPLPDLPPFPRLTTTGCGDQVCVPTDQAEQLWLWIRDVQRWVTLAGSCLDTRAAEPPVQAPAPDPAKVALDAMEAAQTQVILEMQADHPTVDVSVIWVACGQENSFYYPGEHMIVLCTEMVAHPDAAPFFAAHEMGHAIATQLADDPDEESADELGALGLIKHADADAVLAAALYHRQRPDQDHRPGDEHPGNAFRAWNLACMAAGSDGAPDGCVALYWGTRIRWAARVGD